MKNAYKEDSELWQSHVEMVEGRLLEAHRLIYGILPPWNKIGGAVRGKLGPFGGGHELFSSATAQTLGPMTSRSSLRELSANPTYQHYEEFVHAARLRMLMGKSDFLTAFDSVHDELGTRDRIVTDAYLSKQPNLECIAETEENIGDSEMSGQ